MELNTLVQGGSDSHKIRISEIFYSLEGEGPFTGRPTLFVRTFGCNFTCKGFSRKTDSPVFLSGTNDLNDFVPTTGCDSIYAWHPAYKSQTKWYTVPELAQEILRVLDKESRNKASFEMPVLSFTGGEPTLHQDAIAALIQHPLMSEFTDILIETNASVPLSTHFTGELDSWYANGDNRVVVWSNSPKLSNSGESRDVAINPEVILQQLSVGGSLQYLKFVSPGTTESFLEIEEAVKDYNKVLKLNEHDTFETQQIFVMPEGATIEQQIPSIPGVASHCLNYGYTFCLRAHIYIYGNAIGT